MRCCLGRRRDSRNGGCGGSVWPGYGNQQSVGPWWAFGKKTRVLRTCTLLTYREPKECCIMLYYMTENRQKQNHVPCLNRLSESLKVFVCLCTYFPFEYGSTLWPNSLNRKPLTSSSSLETAGALLHQPIDPVDQQTLSRVAGGFFFSRGVGDQGKTMLVVLTSIVFHSWSEERPFTYTLNQLWFLSPRIRDEATCQGRLLISNYRLKFQVPKGTLKDKLAWIPGRKVFFFFFA